MKRRLKHLAARRDRFAFPLERLYLRRAFRE